MVEENKEAQPQDFLELEQRARAQIEGLRSTMGMFSVESIKAIAARKLELSEELRQQLSAQAEQVTSMVNEMKDTVRANRNSEANIDGCLIGEESDYLDGFDAQVAKMNAQFDLTKEHWRRKIDSDDDCLRQIEQIQANFAKQQLRISAFLSEPVRLVKIKSYNHLAIKTPYSAIKNGQSFCWPTLEQLESLKLREPMQLKAVRTKGLKGSLLSGIQLLFNNGIESPFEDTQDQRAETDGVKTVELSGKNITKIHAHIGSSASV